MECVLHRAVQRNNFQHAVQRTNSQHAVQRNNSQHAVQTNNSQEVYCVMHARSTFHQATFRFDLCQNI